MVVILKLMYDMMIIAFRRIVEVCCSSLDWRLTVETLFKRIVFAQMIIGSWQMYQTINA